MGKLKLSVDNFCRLRTCAYLARALSPSLSLSFSTHPAHPFSLSEGPSHVTMLLVFGMQCTSNARTTARLPGPRTGSSSSIIAGGASFTHRSRSRCAIQRPHRLGSLLLPRTAVNTILLPVNIPCLLPSPEEFSYVSTSSVSTGAATRFSAR